MVKDKNFGERENAGSATQDAQMCIKLWELCNYLCRNSAKHSRRTSEVSNNIRVTIPALRVSKCNEFRSFSPSNFPSLSVRRHLPIAINSKGSQEK